ncbi:MAG: hypothetical protein VZS44_10625 [Bacilli bacterium]|nr:hypothetical protein [Bacilli bacterium]
MFVSVAVQKIFLHSVYDITDFTEAQLSQIEIGVSEGKVLNYIDPRLSPEEMSKRRIYQKKAKIKLNLA